MVVGLLAVSCVAGENVNMRKFQNEHMEHDHHISKDEVMSEDALDVMFFKLHDTNGDELLDLEELKSIFGHSSVGASTSVRSFLPNIVLCSCLNIE